MSMKHEKEVTVIVVFLGLKAQKVVFEGEDSYVGRCKIPYSNMSTGFLKLT